MHVIIHSAYGDYSAHFHLTKKKKDVNLEQKISQKNIRFTHVFRSKIKIFNSFITTNIVVIFAWEMYANC